MIAKIPTWLQILLALFLGAVIGGIVNATCVVSSEPTVKLNEFGDGYLGFTEYIGSLFMQALKMIIVPLIFSSVVVGIAGVGKEKGFGKRGLKTLLYYMSTSAIAIVIGLTIVNLVKPGHKDGKPNEAITKIFKNEDNAKAYTADVAKKLEKAGIKDTNETSAQSVTEIFKRMIPENVFEAFGNNDKMLALITVSLLTGFGLLFISGGAREQLLGFFQALNELMLLVTGWIMLFAPIGVFGLVSATVTETGFGLFAVLLKYFFVVVTALAIHMFVAMPLILKYVAKVSPIRHFKAMRNALLTAFSTSSSSGTLPVTMRAVQENAGVSKKVTSFVLPLGATVNMDGTALYECIAVLFISQVLGLELTLAEQLSVVVLALMTSIGVAGVPSASLVAIVIIVNNVLVGPGKLEAGQAAGVIGMLLAVDRLLDMSRTAVNVFSDSCGAIVIAKLEGETGLLQDPMHTAHEPLPERTD
ncbi:MAG: proton glutamate symport protein [Verrucomicrobiales bacterium]|jgi:proton glutamate symport protein